MLVRRAEISRVERSVRSGQPVVLTGAAGIGKTTMARTVLAGHPPVREAVARASLSWVPFSLLRDLVTDPGDADVDQVTAQVIHDNPGSLLLDDVQWADDGSIEVVERLTGFVPTIATVRVVPGEETPVVDHLVAAGYVHVPVSPLGAGDAPPLGEALAPHLDEQAVAELVVRAAGNPLLLTELGTGRAASATLAQALYARLDSAPAAARTAMERLSVLGRPCPPELLGPGVDDLVALGLARADDAGVAVEHALQAEVVLAALGDRADEVRRALACDVDDAEAAHLLARAGDRAEARRRALRAADRAHGRDRAGLLAFAVACAEEGDPDVELRVAAARAHLEQGDAPVAEALAVVPPDLVDRVAPFDRGRLALVAAYAALGHHDYVAFAAHADQAWPLLAGTDTAEEVEMMALSTSADTRVNLDGRPVVDRARAAVALADRIGARQAYARSRLGSVLLTAGDPGWAAMYETALEQARADGDDMTVLLATEALVLGLWITGDVTQASAIAHEQADREQAGPRHRWLTARAYASILDALIGRDREAIVAAGAPLLGEEPAFRCRPFLEVAVALSRVDLGRVVEAELQLRGALARAGTHDQWRSVVVWAEAEVAWANGDLDRLETAATTVAALDVGDYPPAVIVRVLLAHARLLAGRDLAGIAPAVGVFPVWAPFSDEWAGLALAASGDVGGSAEAFTRAADGWAPSDLRSRVRCLWAAGAVAQRGGDPTARARLELALSEAEDAELLGLASRARQALRDLGVVVRPAGTAARPGGLTRRQAQMLDLVAAGRTSSQIAAALHLSSETVDQVIGSAVRALGASNRRSAAARWRELVADQAASNDPDGAP